MCGYEGDVLAATPDGTVQFRPYSPVFTWNDPRMQKPAEVYSPGPQPDPSDPAYASWQKKEASQKGQYVMLMRRRAILAQVFFTYPMAAKAVGQPAPFGGGPYLPMTGWSDGRGTSCTFTNPKVVAGATGDSSIGGAYDIAPASAWTDSDGVFHPATPGHPAWVPYAKGKLPSVGDSYILTGSKANDGLKSYGRFLHVGTVVHVDVSADGVFWITADGGQNDEYQGGQAAHLVRRKFTCMTNMDKLPKAPHFSGGAEGDLKRLHGWLDMGDPRVNFDLSTDTWDYKNLDNGYRLCGAWIERARAG